MFKIVINMLYYVLLYIYILPFYLVNKPRPAAGISEVIMSDIMNSKLFLMYFVSLRIVHSDFSFIILPARECICKQITHMQLLTLKYVLYYNVYCIVITLYYIVLYYIAVCYIML